MGTLGDEVIWASIIFGTLSAISWLASAVITPVLTDTYWDGPPAHLVRKMKLGSGLNAAGAIFAALAMATQTYSTYSAMS